MARLLLFCSGNSIHLLLHSVLLAFLAKKTVAAGAGRKKAAVDLDSSSDFDFGVSKPKKQLASKAEPKAKATKPKVQKAAKKPAVVSLYSSDEESSGKKKATHTTVQYAVLMII